MLGAARVGMGCVGGTPYGSVGAVSPTGVRTASYPLGATGSCPLGAIGSVGAGSGTA